MISSEDKLSLRHLCELLALNRSSTYYRELVKDDTTLANRIGDIYREFPIYGYRRITAVLHRTGEPANGKRVLRIMRDMGLKAIYPAPNTTVRDKAAYVYPSRLKTVQMQSPHQVWQVDITYLRTESGFIYMTALIDVYSRMVVAWGLSNTLDRECCIRVLECGLHNYGRPGIVNSDQGCQFTSQDWVNTLGDQGIQISMSGQGRSNDNAYIERLWRTLKYEYLHLRNPRTIAEYKQVLPKFIQWYNYDRPHQSLGYKTPYEMLTRTGTHQARDSLILVS